MCGMMGGVKQTWSKVWGIFDMRYKGTGSEEKTVERFVCFGLLAHVDAGKTTLAEAILYECGAIRQRGRVDHGDAFLDTYDLEKKRGITIFSKQAVCRIGSYGVTLLDTPGHSDFSGDLERSLSAMDMAILVINGAEGVEPHTVELWHRLRRKAVPVILFINKTDMPSVDRDYVTRQLEEKLSERCLDYEALFTDADVAETAALLSDEIMRAYTDGGEIPREAVRSAFLQRKIFPYFWGSALSGSGVGEFVKELGRLIGRAPKVSEDTEGEEQKEGEAQKGFQGLVIRIERDERQQRQSVVKILSGHLEVRSMLAGEKVNELRIYSGKRYEVIDSAGEGQIIHVLGPLCTYAGQVVAAGREMPLQDSAYVPTEGNAEEAVMSYDLHATDGYDHTVLYKNMKLLEEEEPLFSVSFDEKKKRVSVRLTGELQKDVLKHLLNDRFGVDVSFSAGSVSYKETIEGSVEGIGHFEPLRHYAEVHIRIESAERGSGIRVSSVVPDDGGPENWQKQALKYMNECTHKGVLTGSPLTDVRLILTAIRGHQKHTESGDFREAVCRAIRQGLRKSKSVLLEPQYQFEMRMPTTYVGYVLTQLQRLGADVHPPRTEMDETILKGGMTVRALHCYFDEFQRVTKGKGRLQFVFSGYEACKDEEEVIRSGGYDPDRDENAPCGSIFCSGGAGYTVLWQDVDDMAHIPPASKKDQRSGREPGQGHTDRIGDFSAGETEAGCSRRSNSGKKREKKGEKKKESMASGRNVPYERKPANPYRIIAQKRLSDVRNFEGLEQEGRNRNANGRAGDRKKSIDKKTYLLVDGYNIIFAWPKLARLAKENMDAARGRLLDILSDYQGFAGCTVIVVFDAYRVEGDGRTMRYHQLHVVFTKEAETADQYIEKTVGKLLTHADVTVATSDRTEQVIIMGKGAGRLSATDLSEEVARVRRLVRERIKEQRQNDVRGKRRYLFDHADKQLASKLEYTRLHGEEE